MSEVHYDHQDGRFGIWPTFFTSQHETDQPLSAVKANWRFSGEEHKIYSNNASSMDGQVIIYFWQYAKFIFIYQNDILSTTMEDHF